MSLLGCSPSILRRCGRANGRFLREEYRRLADQTIVFGPLPTTRPVVANAVRRLDQPEYLFAQSDGGQSFHSVVDLEPEDLQVLYEGGPVLGKLDYPISSTAIATGFARYIETNSRLSLASSLRKKST